MAGGIPAVKAILPFLTEIVTMAMPVFTKKADKTGSDEITRNQISELQEAVTQSAESQKILATQLQQIITDIETVSVKIERKFIRIMLLSILAIGLSMFAIFLWLISRISWVP